MKREYQSKTIGIFLTTLFFAWIILGTLAHAGVNNWTVRTNPATEQINGVAYGDGIYVTAGDTQATLSSLDAIDWQVETSASTNNLLDVVFGNNMFVSVGKNCMFSDDGQNWNEVFFDPTSGLRSIAFGNSMFVGVGYYAEATVTATSLDGESWVFNPAVSGSPSLVNVTYGDGLFVAVGSAGTAGTVYTSIDGITWEAATILPAAPTTPLTDVAYGNGVFVAVGNAGALCTSYDGQNWVYESLGSTTTFRSVAFGDGNFVLAAYNTSSGERLYASQDAVDWAPVCTIPAGSTLKRVRYTNDSFIAVGKYTATSYGLIIQSESNLSSNANLDSLSVSGGTLSPSFSPTIKTYTASIPNIVSSITVTQCRQDSHASVTINAPGLQGPLQCGIPSDPIALSVGSNMIYIQVTAADGTVKTYTITAIRAADDPANADLSGLTVSQGVLTPAFTSNTTSYADTVANSISSMTVTPTVANSGATVTVNGVSVASGSASQSISLNVGSNTITIVVTSRSGAVTKTYTLTASRLPSANADLSGLTVSQGTLTPSFAAATTSYTDSVANSIASMTVTPTAADATATITVNGSAVASGSASQAINLDVGSNTITVTVTAQDSSTKTYTITVTRAPSNNADLSGLTVDQGALTPAFSAATTSYADSVGNSVTGMTVTPTAAGAGASITVNGAAVASGSASQSISLEVGNNTISIVVTAQDNTTSKTYTITVNRAGSGNADLSDLSVSQGTMSPAFDSGTTSYTDSVANSVTSMTVTPTAADASATITVNGTAVASGSASQAIDLNVGDNTITIVVAAQDGLTFRTYTVTVTRAPSSNADLSGLSVSQGTLTPVFDSDTTSYTDSVANSVTGMTVTPTTADTTATITVNGTATVSGSTSESIGLNVGDNTITVAVTAQDGTTTRTYTITATRAASSNADLSSLTVSQGTLTPAFTADTTSYTDSVTNSISSMTVTPTASESSATITVNGTAVLSGSASGELALNVGENTISVLVTAQDGSTTKTYTVTVTRAASNNADLSDLTVSQGTLTPTFAAATTSYTDSVASGISSVTVTPTVADATATVTVNGMTVTSGSASQSIPLSVGENTITVIVTAQDGSTTRTYTVTVTRTASNNADLSDLSVSQGTLSPAFSAGTTSYTDSVANSAASMTVTPTAADAGATITVNGTAVASGSASQAINLSVGDNTITIVVTAQDGSTTNTYILTVTRALSGNADLGSLLVSQGTLSPAFSAGTTSYTDSVANSVTSMTVTPTVADATASVTVNGTTVASGSPSQAINLGVGSNTITVIVTAQDSSTKTYTIAVNRAGSDNADLSSLTVDQGTLAPSFAAATTSYTDSVANSVTSMTVTPTAAGTGATITVNGSAVASGSASQAINLSVGDNTITIIVTAQDGSTTKTYSITATRVPSTNAELSGLTVSQGTLTPSFDAATTSYTDSVANSITSMTVTPTAAGTGATITVNGTAVASGSASQAINLSVGDNTITIIVTAQDNSTTSTYTVTVTRAPSSNADLSGLTVSQGTLTPAFSSGTTSYADSVANSVTGMTVTPTAAGTGATITVNGTSVSSGSASQSITLSVGSNTISIVVTAQDGTTTQTYTVTVDRASPVSDNADLSSLTISQGELSPAFASATTTYADSVAYTVSSLTVTPSAADTGATITVNGTAVASGTASQSISMAVGDNTITVVVTAADLTTTRTYTITVNRAAASTNADLSGLAVSQGTLSPAFSADTTSYTNSVANSAASMTVTPTAAGTGATITVNGSAVTSGAASQALDLSVGDNTITVIVTAQDGTTTKTYTITVTRAPSSDADLSSLTVSQGALTPAFASGTTSYSDSVANSVTGMTVTPTAAGTGATITVNGTAVTSGSPSQAIDLAIGNNTITIVVTAQDTTTSRTYTITVNRAGSGNADLSDLTVSQGALTPSFASGTTAYTDSVANSVTGMTVTPTVAEANATVTVNGSTVASGSPSQAISLSVGSNTITIVVTAQDGMTTKTYTVTVTRASSSNADLGGLTVSQGALTPAFSSGTTSYTDQVANSTSSMTVTPTAADATATITVNGSPVASGSPSQSINLGVGDNTITIVVTAQDSSTKTYTIIVNRAPSSNADLYGLTVSQGTLTPAFSSGTTSYTDPVANSASSMTVTPTAADATATITVNGSSVASGSASQAINLSVGDNTITIVVTAQDGSTTRTYTITVSRAPSVNADLSSLTVDQGALTPTFSSGTTTYTDSVTNSVTSMTVTPTAADANATITVNGSSVASGSASQAISLSVGDNTITIVVTAQDSSTKTYTVTVARASSSNADLGALTVSQGALTPAFSSGTTSYTDSVANSVAGMTVTPTAADANSTITVNGSSVASGSASQTINLSVGDNTITIIVTAQDGTTTRIYTVTVNRAPSSNADLGGLTVSQGSLTPAFGAAITSYSNSVANSIESMTVTPTAADATATITVNGSLVASGSASQAINLGVGDNTITIVVTAQDGTTTRTYTITVNRAPSGNADLGGLTVSQGTLTPVFSSGTTSYTDSVANSVTSMTVTPTAAEENASITVNGSAVASGSPSQAINLGVGDNTITIVVTSQDGTTTRTYSVTVNRAPSSNADLAGLTVSQGTLTPVFSSGTTSYTDSVANSVTSMTATPTVAEANATITVNGSPVASGSASQTINLGVGNNTITIVVTAQDGTTTRTYTVTVNRAASSNADLSGLTINHGTLAPVFASVTTSYAVSLANSYTSIAITATAAGTGSTIKINGSTVTSGVPSGNIPLMVGTNTINVVVTAQDGSTTRTYTLVVTRAGSSNADLIYLTVSQGTLSPSFAPGTTGYADSVANSVTGITVTPLASGAGAVITVNGTAVASGSASPSLSLNVGSNTISIVVTAQDLTTTKTYTITVNRASPVSDNADLSSLLVSNGTLTPVFTPATTGYAGSVDFSVSSLTVTPTASDTGATITVNGSAVASGSASQAIGLDVGTNTISVLVTAQDGSTTRAYTITVTRSSARAVPGQIEAEDYTAMSGITLETCTDINGGQDATSLNSRDWIDYTVTAASTGSYSIQYRYQNSSTATYQLQLRIGSTTLVTTSLPPSAAWATTGASTTFTLNAGSQTLRLYAGSGGTGLKVNWLQISSSAVSNNADLINLSVSQGALSPAFSSSQTSYSDTVTNSVASMTVTPTAAGPGASITVNGTAVANGAPSQAINLNVGVNTITVVVTAQDGTTTKTYTIGVTRLASSNADLSGLTVSQGLLSPAFAAGTTSYTDSVANAVTGMTVTPTASDANSTIQVNGDTVASGTASGNIALAVGDNTITVVVTAQDGSTTKTYTINVTRADTLAPLYASSYNTQDISSNVITSYVNTQDVSTVDTPDVEATPTISGNCNLSGLLISQGDLSPAFAPDTTRYAGRVTQSISSLTVTPTAADPGSTITVNGVTVNNGSSSQAIRLAEGDNLISVVVLAEDGSSSRTYIIIVNRAPASHNADLSSMALDQAILNPSFTSAQTSYTGSVPNSVTAVTVTFAAADTLATMTINGTLLPGGSASQTINLNTGSNTISIVVTAEDGATTKTYTISLTRLPSSNADLSAMSISRGTLDPEFASTTLNYSVCVPNGTADFTVTPTAADAGAAITVNGSALSSKGISGPIGLEVGSNTVSLVVVAPDGSTTKTYSITVNRSAYNKMIPGVLEAESFDAQSGVTTAPTTDSSGGLDLTSLATGNYADYNLCTETSGTYILNVRAFNPSPSTEYRLELRSGTTVLATVAIPGGTNWSTRSAAAAFKVSSGDKTFRLYVSNGDAQAFRVNWIRLIKQ